MISYQAKLNGYSLTNSLKVTDSLFFIEFLFNLCEYLMGTDGYSIVLSI